MTGRDFHLTYRIAAHPFGALLVFYGYVVAFRLGLGHWPSYGKPDAGAFQGPLVIVDVAVGLVLLLTALSPVFLLPWVLAALFPSGTHIRGPAAIYTCAWLLWASSCASDPGRFYQWWID